MIQVYRYRFREDIDLRDVEETLLLAFVASEGLFGEARIRMDAGYCLDAEARTLAVDATTVVGQVANAIFTAFALREFGRSGLTVRRGTAEVRV